MMEGPVSRKIAPRLSSRLVTWKRKQQSWLLGQKIATINNNYFYMQYELLYLTNEVMKWKEMITFLESQLSGITPNFVAERRPHDKKLFQNLIDDYNEQLNENNLVISILKSKPRISSFPIYLCDEAYSHFELAIAELDSLIIIFLFSLIFLWVSIEAWSVINVKLFCSVIIK